MLGYYVEMRDSSNRDKTTALAMFWLKLKTGLSFGQICSLFNLHPVQQKQRVADAIHTVSEQLVKFFVPEHLGVESLTRETAMAHATIYAKTFFGPTGSYLSGMELISTFKKVRTMKWPEKLILDPKAVN